MDKYVTIADLQNTITGLRAEIREADKRRGDTEARRSKRRNDNRIAVTLVSWAAAVLWPVFALAVLHSRTAVAFGASVGFFAGAWIQVYARWRDY